MLLTLIALKRVLCRYLVVLEQSFENLHALFVALVLKEIANLDNLGFDLLVFLFENKSGLQGLNLGFEEAKGIWIGDFQILAETNWQLFIWLPQFFFAVSIGAVLAEVTLFFLLKVLAHLRLIVVIRDVQHLILHFNR